MMQRFYDVKSDLAAVMVTLPNCPPMVDGECLKWIPEVLLILAEMEALSKRVSSATKVTSSIVIPFIKILYDVLKEMKLETPVAIQLRKDLMKEAEVRLDKLEKHPVLLMATLLDPRFKTKCFKNITNGGKAITYVVEELEKLLTPERSAVDNAIVEVQVTDPFLRRIEASSAPKKKTQLSNYSRAHLMITDYIKQDIDVKLNPLKYWRERSKECPELSKFAL